MLAAEHTPAAHRRYDLAKLRAELFRAAVSSKRITLSLCACILDQKQDLERQKQVLELLLRSPGLDV